MSKVRINDLARELEVKSKQILDALESMGMADGKTHSSSIEAGEAEKVRGYFERGSRPAGSGGSGSRNEQDNRPKIDLSNVSKPGDVMKAVLARKQEAERQAQFPQRPAPSTVVVRPAGSAPAVSTGSPASTVARPAVAPPSRVVTPPPVEPRPEPRKIVPQPRQAPPIVHVAPPAASAPAIASRPPAGPVIARPPAGSPSGTPAARPAVVVAPPPVAVVVKPPVPAANSVATPSASACQAPAVAVVAPPAKLPLRLQNRRKLWRYRSSAMTVVAVAEPGACSRCGSGCPCISPVASNGAQPVALPSLFPDPEVADRLLSRNQSFRPRLLRCAK